MIEGSVNKRNGMRIVPVSDTDDLISRRKDDKAEITFGYPKD